MTPRRPRRQRLSGRAQNGTGFGRLQAWGALTPMPKGHPSPPPARQRTSCSARSWEGCGRGRAPRPRPPSVRPSVPRSLGLPDPWLCPPWGWWWARARPRPTSGPGSRLSSSLATPPHPPQCSASFRHRIPWNGGRGREIRTQPPAVPSPRALGPRRGGQSVEGAPHLCPPWRARSPPDTAGCAASPPG